MMRMFGDDGVEQNSLRRQRREDESSSLCDSFRPFEPAFPQALILSSFPPLNARPMDLLEAVGGVFVVEKKSRRKKERSHSPSHSHFDLVCTHKLQILAFSVVDADVMFSSPGSRTDAPKLTTVDSSWRGFCCHTRSRQHPSTSHQVIKKSSYLNRAYHLSHTTFFVHTPVRAGEEAILKFLCFQKGVSALAFQNDRRRHVVDVIIILSRRLSILSAELVLLQSSGAHSYSPLRK